MDASNQTPIADTAQPVAPQNPVSLPGSEGEQNSSGNKMVLWFIVGLVAIIAIVGGTYFLLSRQQPPVPKAQTASQETPAPAEDLEGDLNNINADSGPDADFASIDQDLQQL